tara:strand:- start:122 stop:370 length:249 start_codon:yes stop_codon:yes gene_type:complete
LKKTKLKISWPNNIETYAYEGDDWFLIAEKAGFKIPTGCLTGSCGACEIDVNGKTVRACMRNVMSNQDSLVTVSFIVDPFWE